MALKKKSAKQVVEEVVAKVNEELAAPKKEVIKEEDTVLHYYRCNITLANGKECNCPAFM